MESLNKDGIKLWLTILSSVVVPGSGYVLIGLPKRGLTMIMWMVAFAFITYHLTPVNISFVGKISGGILVWVLSVLDVEKKAKKISVSDRGCYVWQEK
jgi:hypothetical protein